MTNRTSGEPLEPLKELARRWRDEADKEHKESLCAMEQRECADELESLLPTLSAAIVEQVRLERAAALREAAERTVLAITEEYARQDEAIGSPPSFPVITKLVHDSIVRDSDRSALNAHDAEVRLDERKMCAFHKYWESCTCFHCRRIDTLERKLGGALAKRGSK